MIALGDAPGSEPLTALLGGPTAPPAVAISPDAVAVMPYSSGTTGFPKGVMLTHRNMIAQCLAIEAVTDGDVIVPGAPVLAVLPFFHIYGIMAFLTFGLMRGARLVTMPAVRPGAVRPARPPPRGAAAPRRAADPARAREVPRRAAPAPAAGRARRRRAAVRRARRRVHPAHRRDGLPGLRDDRGLGRDPPRLARSGAQQAGLDRRPVANAEARVVALDDRRRRRARRARRDLGARPVHDEGLLRGPRGDRADHRPRRLAAHRRHRLRRWRRRLLGRRSGRRS